jgi:hypothetical protein
MLDEGTDKMTATPGDLTVGPSETTPYEVTTLFGNRPANGRTCGILKT